MNDELDNLWRQRVDVEPPADFADRVMDAVRRERLRSWQSILARVLSSPGVRVAACVLACFAFLYRLAAVVAVFFVQ